MDTITTVDVKKFENSVFFHIKLRQPCFSAKVKDQAKLMEYLTQKAAEIEAKKAAGQEVVDHSTVIVPPGALKAKNGKSGLNVNKITLSSPALDALREHLNETKRNITAPPQYGGYANASGILESLFEVSKDLAERVKADVETAKLKMSAPFDETDKEGNTLTRPGYLQAFLDDYSSAIERAQNLPILDGGLGPLFDIRDYDSKGDVAAAFDIQLRWLALGVPEGLPEELRQQAAEELKADLRNAAEQIKESMRTGFLQLLEHARDTLTIQPGQKPKVIKESLLGNVLQFCEVFSLRNTQGDQDLAALVQEAKERLVGVDPERCRKDANLRAESARLFAEMAEKVDGMITTQKSRKFDLGED